MNYYLDDFMPIDSAFMDNDDPDFHPFYDDDYEYDDDGYIIECPNDHYRD